MSPLLFQQNGRTHSSAYWPQLFSIKLGVRFLKAQFENSDGLRIKCAFSDLLWVPLPSKLLFKGLGIIISTDEGHLLSLSSEKQMSYVMKQKKNGLNRL